ncbi:MAG: exosortase system-associated protein, TIGR04073 family [Myxococcota bacterium]
MGTIMKGLVVLAMVGALLFAPLTATAGMNYDPNDGNGTKIMKKLGRGLVNDLTFWAELPLAWVDYFDQRDPFTAIVFGTADGIVKAADRGWGGLYETVFFAVPSPRYYKPALDPETLFDD